MSRYTKIGLTVLVTGVAVMVLGAILLVRDYIDLVYAETGRVWAPDPLLLVLPIAGVLVALGGLAALARRPRVAAV